MASTMDASEITEQLKCPICDEVPLNNIYQCENGHTFCDICEARIENRCPQCRVQLGSKRIRNRALESLLEGLKLDCPFKNQGCTEKFGRKEMANHLDNCLFGEQTEPPIDITWVQEKNGKVPKYAFIAGMDTGKPVYVIRASHGGNGGVIPGKLKLEDTHSYVAYGGKAVPKSNYEVLTCPEGMLAWISSSGGVVHEYAVAGGKDPNGEAYFIGRVNVDGRVFVGKIHPSHHVCYIANFNEVAYQQYEILVLN